MRAALLFAALAIGVPDRPDPTPKAAMPLEEQLLGEWLLVKHVISGNEVRELNGLMMIFTREDLKHVHLRNGAKESGGTFPYSLDVKKNPAAIRFRPTGYVGIVKIEGDVLWICFARLGDADPPPSFISAAENATTLLQATRVKK